MECGVMPCVVPAEPWEARVGSGGGGRGAGSGGGERSVGPGLAVCHGGGGGASSPDGEEGWPGLDRTTLGLRGLADWWVCGYRCAGGRRCRAAQA